MILVWVFTEKCIEVGFSEIHRTSEEESDDKSKSLDDRIELESLCKTQECRESENDNDEASRHDEE